MTLLLLFAGARVVPTVDAVAAVSVGLAPAAAASQAASVVVAATTGLVPASLIAATSTRSGVATAPVSVRPGQLGGGPASVTETWTGSDGSAWPAQWYTAAGPTIQGNAGRIPGFGLAQLLTPLPGDYEYTLDVTVPATSGATNLFVRTDAVAGSGTPLNGYRIRHDHVAGNVTYWRGVNGVVTFIGNGTGATAMAAGDVAHYRVRVQGSVIRMRVWVNSASEPGTWNVDWTDSTYPQGGIGFGCSLFSGSPALDLDNLVVTALDTISANRTTIAPVPAGVAPTSTAAPAPSVVARATVGVVPTAVNTTTVTVAAVVPTPTGTVPTVVAGPAPSVVAAAVVGVLPGQLHPAVVSDTFTAANGTPWDPAIWQRGPFDDGTVDIQSNQGRIVENTTGNIVQTVALFANPDLRFDVTRQAGTAASLQAWLRASRPDTAGFGGYSDGVAYYIRYDNAGNLELLAFDPIGGDVSLGTATKTALGVGDTLHVRFQAIGSTIRVRTWINAASEPGTWDISATDTSAPGPGPAAVAEVFGSATTDLRFDNVTVTELGTISHDTTTIPAVPAGVIVPLAVVSRDSSIQVVIPAGTVPTAVATVVTDVVAVVGVPIGAVPVVVASHLADVLAAVTAGVTPTAVAGPSIPAAATVPTGVVPTAAPSHDQPTVATTPVGVTPTAAARQDATITAAATTGIVPTGAARQDATITSTVPAGVAQAWQATHDATITVLVPVGVVPTAIVTAVTDAVAVVGVPLAALPTVVASHVASVAAAATAGIVPTSAAGPSIPAAATVTAGVVPTGVVAPAATVLVVIPTGVTPTSAAQQDATITARATTGVAPRAVAGPAASVAAAVPAGVRPGQPGGGAALASETWTGTDGAAWPAQWTTTALSVAPTIQSNTGQQVGNTEAVLNVPLPADVEVTLDATLSSAALPVPFLWVRADSSAGGPGSGLLHNGYAVRIAGNTGGLTLVRYANFSATTIGTGTSLGALTNGDVIHYRFRVQGSNLKVRVWLNAAAEPGTWQIDVNDTTYPTGSVGITQQFITTAATVRYDNLVVTGLDGVAANRDTIMAVPAGIVPTGATRQDATITAQTTTGIVPTGQATHDTSTAALIPVGVVPTDVARLDATVLAAVTAGIISQAMIQSAADVTAQVSAPLAVLPTVVASTTRDATATTVAGVIATAVVTTTRAATASVPAGVAPIDVASHDTPAAATTTAGVTATGTVSHDQPTVATVPVGSVPTDTATHTASAAATVPAGVVATGATRQDITVAAAATTGTTPTGTGTMATSAAVTIPVGVATTSTASGDRSTTAVVPIGAAPTAATVLVTDATAVVAFTIGVTPTVVATHTATATAAVPAAVAPTDVVTHTSSVAATVPAGTVPTGVAGPSVPAAATVGAGVGTSTTATHTVLTVASVTTGTTPGGVPYTLDVEATVTIPVAMAQTILASRTQTVVASPTIAVGPTGVGQFFQPATVSVPIGVSIKVRVGGGGITEVPCTVAIASVDDDTMVAVASLDDDGTVATIDIVTSSQADIIDPCGDC